MSVFDPFFRFFTNRDLLPSTFDQLILLASTFLLTAILLSYIFFRNPTSTMLIPCCIGLVLNTLLTPSLAIDRVADQAKSNQIKMAITHLDMFNALADSEFVYDFNVVTSTPFQPGSVLNANAATWPIMGSGQMTVAQLNLGPCAMLAPHLHPRATNVVISVVGQTRTYMRSENGAIDRQTVLTPGKMTIFPRASMHSMINEGCGNNVLYSFLDNNDAGTLNMAQAMMSVGPEIGMTVMPFINMVNDDWNSTAQEIPDIGMGSQPGMAECKKRCGIT